ncbi:FAD-dependent oxidoreductase [Chloroflexota bacterium]
MQYKEADVVALGYGGAGAAAAIAAHDAGAKVIILEKAEQGGGNTKCAGGTIREYLDLEKAITYFEAISFETVSREIYQAFVEDSNRIPQWIKELGGELERRPRVGFPPAPHVVFPHVAGADGIGGRWRVKGSGKHGGANLWAFLSQNVEKRGIEVLFNTAAKQLIRNEHKEVIGLLAHGPTGEIRVKSRRAVVLTCGGFECNPEMQLSYLGLKFYTLGTPGNTGDGIRMAQEVGADLWHMCGLSCGLGYKVPEYELPLRHRMQTGGYIYVDQHGNRFIDEAGTDVHAMAFSFCHLDHKSLTYPRIPSYVIFDESTRQSSPISQGTGWMSDYYQWSKDNTAEIKKGWIKTAETIRDLALQIGVGPETLQETVSKYNLYYVGGYDPDFGRHQETLSPIAKPPFYAIAMWPCLINTQGGPKRNAEAQVLDVYGNPIKRLYTAGELGSIWGILYPGAGNITECLAFGRIAGKNAAAEQPVKE